MADDDAIEALKTAGSFLEIYEKTSFYCFRENIEGKPQAVTVDILDQGSQAHEAIRFNCIASTNDGKSLRGDPADSAANAIRKIDWHKLG